MRAAIYNPYLDTLGGGERYTFSFSRVLVENGYNVDIEWREKSILDKASKKFGIDCSKFNISADIKRGDGYDLCFWVTDGSIPSLKSRKNILHFQVPFKDINGSSLLNKMKLFRIKKVVCNSYFTKSFIDKEYGVDSLVIHPPVDTETIKSKKKENVILYVGRFSKLMQSKRQDVLIDTFKKFYDEGFKNWKFILAGGSEVGVGDYIKKLEKTISGYPIFIIENPKFSELLNLYGKAKIFWSAAGYDIEEKKEPQRVEHFGITILEAMSGGAVPIAFAAGGHKEIIDNGLNGILWHKRSELLRETINILKDKERYAKLSESAVKRSSAFSYENFAKQIKENIL